MKHYKYRALVKMYSSSDGHDAALPGASCRLTLRARHHDTRRDKFFTALVSTADGASLHPTGHGVPMTLTVLGDDVPDYLDTGDELALWRGHDIGHGVITRRLFLWTEAT